MAAEPLSVEIAREHYPTMRLFRRKPLETWEPILQHVSAHLAEVISRRRQAR